MRNAKPFLWRATACVAIGTALTASAQTLSIDSHVLSAGASARSESGCFRMTATIAEPSAGYSSSVDYGLETGFLALRRNAPRDDVFFDSFEGCGP